MIINMVWTKSVQITADNPPAIVNMQAIANNIKMAIYMDASEVCWVAWVMKMAPMYRENL